MSGPPRRIVVLGGGTAGWMAACLIAHRWGAFGTTVTVVESPEIGIIGVGEGSTPQLKAMFDTLGIAESDWMPACGCVRCVSARGSICCCPAMLSSNCRRWATDCTPA